MKRLSRLFVFTLLLIGCATPAATTEPTTLFGALSARFQFGSTEETISHKLIIDPYIVTIKGEVIENRTVASNFKISGLNETVNPEDLTVTYTLCIDKDFVPVDDDDNEANYDEAVTCADDNFVTYVLPTVFNTEDGLFYTTDDETVYHVYGNWLGELRIENEHSDNIAESAFNVEVSPTRPSTTTTFELVNLLLPFSVVGLFAGTMALRKKRFTIPIEEITL